MSNEQFATYQVPIWQAGWALSELNSAGIPILNTARQGDTIVIIIPAQYAAFDHHTAPAHKRRRWLRLPSARLMIWLAVAAIGAAGIWMLVNGGVKLPSMPVLAAPASVPALPDVGGIQRTVDGAVNAAKALFVGLLGMGGLFVAYKFRGPLGQLGGMVGNLAKGLHRGR